MAFDGMRAVVRWMAPGWARGGLGSEWIKGRVGRLGDLG